MEAGTGSSSSITLGFGEANNKGFLSLPTTMSTIFNPQNRKTTSYSQRASEGCSFLVNNDESVMKSKIMAHPLYPRLLAAYVNCQKVGAPPEVVARLEEACASKEALGSSSMGFVGEDPALDQFMEAYCEMLSKYEQELTKPLKEAMVFISRVECQIKTLTQDSAYGNFMNDYGSYGKEVDASANNYIDPQAAEIDLKGQLLKRYSGYFGSLKQDFLKKKKKGKLPKEARQKLLDWWSKHYKWPYPSESQKLALAQSTGLDQKQINNWFINQRKRHWKPSEDTQFADLDTVHPHIYMESFMNNTYPMVDYVPMYSLDIKFSSGNQCL